MNKFSTSLLALAALFLATTPAWAQDFDLSSQRSEIQEYRSVDGQKIDHQGLVISPTPQSISRTDGVLDISGGVKINDKKKAFAADLNFLTTNDKGVKFTIDYGAKAARRLGAKEVSGAYVLSIDAKEIKITGYDEIGAFYGLLTLKQVIDAPVAAGGKLPCLTINDHPDLPLRGVVEGFYGTPWPHQVRLSLIDFMGRFKMNAYVYGPKDDPYHSSLHDHNGVKDPNSPNWRLPYPAEEAARIKELIEACNRNRLDFVWAIHPGQDIKWNEEDYNNLVNKLNSMYDLGVRHFAVFFDDISGEGARPSKQTELLNRLSQEFVAAKKDVKPLILCPTDYNKSWANPTERGSLVYFGNNLNPDIKIFWTGDVVCSDVTPSTMEWVNSRIKRPALFWWNYPVTDYCRHIIMQGPSYGLDLSLSSNELSGLISNPMEHGEASKLALYSVADYGWNVTDYNPIDSWERAIVELTPTAADAYRTFAIHSCDTETGYRRDESWETRTFGIDDYTPEAARELRAEFDRVANVPQLMEQNCHNQLLLTELRPWLAEFGKLGQRGKRTIELIEMFRSGSDDAAFWEKYVANIMTADEMKSYEAHKSGTMKLQPFYDRAMDDMAFRFLQKLTGEVPCAYRGISMFPNSRTTQPRLMLDSDTATHYTSALPQVQRNKESWMGVDLRTVRDVATVNILQGRNSVDDVDFYDHCTLEASADGKQWTTLIADMVNQYVINWSGQPVKARYVRLRRLESKRTNYVAIREFMVNPVTNTFGLTTNGNEQEAMRAFDSNAASAYSLDGTMQFNVDQGATAYTLLLGQIATPVTITLLDAQGNTLQAIAAKPMTTIDLPAGTAAIKLQGRTQVHEIFPTK